MSKDDPARAARLAEALRANLRRRKAQSQISAHGGVTGSPASAEAARPDPERPDEQGR